MPDYCERSVFEALVNALIHRDYLILGSEVHIDIYDDRLTITSPGGMADGTRIQERDISDVSFARRNPVLADVFSRLGYMERQGSGFKKITEAYHAAHNYRDELAPKFYSDASSFHVTLYNLNYSQTDVETGDESEKQAIDAMETGDCSKKQAIEQKINELNVTRMTREKIMILFQTVGFEQIFGRTDISQIIGITVSPAGEIIKKLKTEDLIVPVTGYCKGKWKFTLPEE